MPGAYRGRAPRTVAIIAALLVALLLGVTPAMEEIGENDPLTWSLLAGAGNVLLMSVSTEASTPQRVDTPQQLQQRIIALRRNNR